MAPEDLPREPKTPEASHSDVEGLTDAELEALEDAEDLRLARERSRLAKIEGTVSWESIKAKHGL
ncbi:MAG: hypothetical protein F4Z08_03830 [Chloroflexi bacterium]|nr:hypothetical protein [Chloroflexota bacterium]